MEVFCEIIVKKHGIYDIIKETWEMKKGGMRMRIKNIVLTLKMPKKFDFLMQFAVLILILFGTLMIVSTNVGNTTKDPYICLLYTSERIDWRKR